jgi:hypothetical protein
MRLGTPLNSSENDFRNIPITNCTIHYILSLNFNSAPVSEKVGKEKVNTNAFASINTEFSEKFVFNSVPTDGGEIQGGVEQKWVPPPH